jgi:hypothetical protein
MQQLPLHIPIVFIATTLLTFFLFYRAVGYSKWFLLAATVWLLAQGLVAASGFYTVTHSMPPRFLWLVVPPLLALAALLATRPGRRRADCTNIGGLTLLHSVRVPVELVLYWLYQQKAVPQLMTFEGYNFDILSGITAPFMFYFGHIKKTIPKWGMLLWNIVCLGLLFNIVTHAVLAAPFPFQQLAFEQPNRAVLYLPYVWLPGFIVPLVLTAHCVALRQLLKKR